MPSKCWEEFGSRPELCSFRRAGLPFTLAEEERDESDYKLIEAKFIDLERCLRDIVSETKEPPAPSTYCLSRPYRLSQFNPQMTVHDGHTGTAPVALELLHLSFRTFTYWSFINLYPLPGSPAYLKKTRQINKKAFIRVYQAVNQLLFSMPQLYTAHDDRLGNFEKLFCWFSQKMWIMNGVTTCQQTRIFLKVALLDIKWTLCTDTSAIVFLLSS